MGSYKFPQYRKYIGIDRWFKITSEQEFEELQRVGQRYVLHTIEAVQYPEKLRIEDMLNCVNNHWEIISEQAYEAELSKLN